MIVFMDSVKCVSKKLVRAFPVILFAFVFFIAPSVVATDFTSTNFISRDPVIDDFGGFSSGTEDFQQLNAGGQAAIGESTSSNFIVRSGFLYFTDFTLVQRNWRWYTDEANETPTSSLAAENTTPTDVQNGDILKLRVTIAELAGISSPSQKRSAGLSMRSSPCADRSHSGVTPLDAHFRVR